MIRVDVSLTKFLVFFQLFTTRETILNHYSEIFISLQAIVLY